MSLLIFIKITFDLSVHVNMYDLKIKEGLIIHIHASLQSFFGKHIHEIYMISCIIFHIPVYMKYE